MTSLLRKRLRIASLVARRRRNLIVCGYSGAGKTTASQRLAERLGYFHVEASDFMRFIYHRQTRSSTDSSIDEFAEETLARCPTVVPDAIMEHFGADLPLPTVISGFRTIAEVDRWRQHLGRAPRGLAVVFVDADPAVRFKRLQSRSRAGDSSTFREFQQKDAQQQRMGLETSRRHGKTRIFKNDDTLSHYLEAVDEWVGTPKPTTARIDRAMNDLCHSDRNVQPEDAILLALLNAGTRDRQEYLTSQEIAGVARDILAKSHQQATLAVDQFLDRDFCPEYEVKKNVTSGARMYRLSNTGLSQASRRLGELVTHGN